MDRRHSAFAALAVCAALGSARPAFAQRIAEVQLSPPWVRMVPEAQVQAAATAYDSAGMPVVVRFRWASSNINVATVSDNGLVRAVSPGSALITATYQGQRGRRRAMQVQVMPRQAAPGVPLAPPPPGPMPGGAPPPGPMILAPVHVDSSVKASINCAEPMINAVNPLQACFDQRPTPRVPIPTVAVPCADRSAGLLMWVRVAEDGSVAEVMPLHRGTCPEIVAPAVSAARAMTFNPALKDGRPVAAWARLVIRTTEPPPKQ